MSDCQVKLTLAEVGETNTVDTDIPQGSPAAPVLFIAYLPGMFDEVERAVLGIRCGRHRTVGGRRGRQSSSGEAVGGCSGIHRLGGKQRSGL